MGGVLEVVAPVFTLIGLGYAAARRRWISEEGLKAMGFFVFAFAAPSLLFSSGTRPQGGTFSAAAVLLFVSLLIFALTVPLARRLLGMTLTEASMFGVAAVFGNSVMLGIPVIIAAYGMDAMPPLLGFVGTQTLIVLGVATVVAEIGLQSRGSWQRTLKATALGVARNPVVMSVVVAMLWRLLGLPVPGVARSILDMLGAAAPPVALFCLGGSLASIGGTAAWQETLLASVLKLLVQPALVWALGWLVGLSPLEMAVAVTVAALPTGANAFVLARRYATGADRTGATVVLTTAISVVTLSILIGWFRG